MSDDVLTPEAAAALLKVTPDTIREWTRAGKIPAVRIGRLWRFSDEQLRTHVRSGAERNLLREVPRLGGSLVM
jgi:excisionase family DNA binding protein